MIRTETDSAACEKLWNPLSPWKDARDDWDRMCAFHDQDKRRFHFLVRERGDGQPDGLVPAEIGFEFNKHPDTFTTGKRQKFNYDLHNIRRREPVLRWSEDDEAEINPKWNTND